MDKQSISFTDKKTYEKLEKILENSNLRGLDSSFPFGNDKMYGGSIMALGFLKTKDSTPETPLSIYKLITKFYKPIRQQIEVESREVVSSDQRQFKWTRCEFLNDDVCLASTDILYKKEVKDPVINKDIDKLNTSSRRIYVKNGSIYEKRGEKHLLDLIKKEESGLLENENTFPLTHSEIPFYDYIVSFVKSIEKISDNEIRDSRIFNFLKKISESNSLIVTDSGEDFICMDYEISEEVKNKDIKAYVIYIIDILMTTNASIFNDKKFNKRTEVFISSMDHEMTFFRSEFARKGVMEFSLKTVFRESPIYKIEASIFSEDELICDASQNVYIDKLKIKK